MLNLNHKPMHPTYVPNAPMPPHPVGPHHHDIHHCLDYIIINPYNKVCFKDKEEALAILINKDLHAGETAYAYYYDVASPYGVNVISAVGNIKVGAPNVVFENSDYINRHLSAINDVLSSHADLINDNKKCIDAITKQLEYIESVNDRMDDFNKTLSTLMDEVSDTAEDVMKLNVNVETIKSVDLVNLANKDTELQSKVNNITEHIQAVDENISSIIDAANKSGDVMDIINSSINSWIEQHEKDVKVLETSIINDCTSTLIKVANDLNDTINTLRNSTTEQIGELKVLLHAQLDELESTATSIRNEFTEDLINVLNENIKKIDDKAKDLTDKFTTDINLVNKRIDDVSDMITDTSSDLYHAMEHLDISVHDFVNNSIHNMEVRCDNVERKENENFSAINSRIDSNYNDLNSLIIASEKRSNDKLSVEVNLLRSAIATGLNSVEAKIHTINTSLSGHLDASLAQYESMLTKAMTIDVSNYVERYVQDFKINILDNAYITKAEEHHDHFSVNSGIVRADGTGYNWRLNIDETGVLRVNGHCYKLTEVFDVAY